MNDLIRRYGEDYVRLQVGENEFKKMLRRNALALRYWQDALRGKPSAMEAIREAYDGKNPQPLEGELVFRFDGELFEGV